MGVPSGRFGGIDRQREMKEMDADAEAQVPVFVQPLARVLAQAESQCKRLLTEDEVVRIRDSAACIMLSASEASELQKNRGYRDVDPKDVWMDWHRARCEIYGAGRLPSVALTILSPQHAINHLIAICERDDLPYVAGPRDPQISLEFEKKRSTLRPTATEVHGDEIARHEAVLKVETRPFNAEQAPVACYHALQMIQRFLEMAATAIVCDSSMISHANDNWVGLSKRASTAFRLHGASGDEFWEPMFRAFVQFPVFDQASGDLFTVGMHLLGQPEIAISTERLQQAGIGQQQDAINDLFTRFALHQLAQKDAATFVAGCDFEVIWEPQSRFEDDDARYDYLWQWRIK